MNFYEQEEKFKSNYNKKFKFKHVKKKCLCFNTNHIKLFNLDRYNLKTSVVLCDKCGLVYSNKVLGNLDLSEFYSSDSYRHFYNILSSNNDGDFVDSQYHDTVSIKEPLAIIQRCIPHINNLNILDFGAGYAQLSRTLNKDNNLICIDQSKKTIESLNKDGIKAYSGGVEILKELNYQYDLIILSHVVEHFYDFNKELQTIMNYLKQDGFIYIEVPNLDVKYNMDQIQNAHNYYFTKNTLFYFASKLGLQTNIYSENVNKLHLGGMFFKKNNKFKYSKADEINKIRNYHKSLYTLNVKLEKINIYVREKIKFFLGVKLTARFRKLIN